MSYNILELLAVFSIAAFLVVAVAWRRRYFWPLLLIVNIFGCGPRIFGYGFADEIFTASILLGAFFWLIVSDRKISPGVLTFHKLIFAIWILYMIAESFRGILINSDLRIIRWVLFYILLGGVSILICQKKDQFPFPSLKDFSFIASISLIVYFIVYLLLGMYSVKVLGGYGQFSMQFLKEGFTWSGSALAVFPAIIGFPAAIMLTRFKGLGAKVVSWSVICLTMVVAFYYDSRICWMIVFFGLFSSLSIIKFKNVILIVLSFLMIFFIFVGNPKMRLYSFIESLTDSAQSLWAPKREADLTRTLQFRAAFIRLNDNPKTFFIGDGIYAHRYTLYPCMHELYNKYMHMDKYEFIQPGHEESYREAEEAKIFRTTAFTGLTVDTGLVGILLFISNFIFVLIRLIKYPGQYRDMWLAYLFLALMWLFVNNISDIILFYLLIMPGGIMEQLNNLSLRRALKKHEFKIA